MRLARWAVVALVTVHGLIHLLGFVEGLGWADVEQLSEPIGTAGAVAWLVAAAAVITAAVMMVLAARGWWLVTGLAAMFSQAMIATSWSDASAGTAANAVMLGAATYGFLRDGPYSFRAAYRRQAAATLATSVAPGPQVTEQDLGRLPELVATYLRRSGALGRPRIRGFRAKIVGRIRNGPEDPWMPFTGEQVNTYGSEPARLFHIDASMRGVPVDVLHVFGGGATTMRGRLGSVLPVLNASGPAMTRAETVTVFNDVCLFAPAALVDAPVEWEPVDDHRVRGRFRLGSNVVSADLVFDAEGDLVDFVSDDRLRATAGGKELTPAQWCTPVLEYAEFAGRRAIRKGEGRWRRPEDQEPFTYLELEVHDLNSVEAVVPVSMSAPSAHS